MVTLELVQETDRHRLLDWRNRPEVSRWMYANHRITPEEHDHWFDAMLDDRTQRQWIIWWQSTPVGVVHFRNISELHRRGEFGIYVAEPAALGTGAAEEATVLALDHAFDRLLVQRVTCEALSANIRASRLYERVGFRREGYLRSHVRRGDEPLDVVVFGLLAAEWATLRPGLFIKSRDRHLQEGNLE